MVDDAVLGPLQQHIVIESDFIPKDHSVSVLSLTLIIVVPIRAVLCFIISFPFRFISVPTEMDRNGKEITKHL